MILRRGAQHCRAPRRNIESAPMSKSYRQFVVAVLTIFALAGCTASALPRGDLIQDEPSDLCFPNPGGADAQVPLTILGDSANDEKTSVQISKVWADGEAGLHVEQALVLPEGEWAQVVVGDVLDPTAPIWRSARAVEVEEPVVLASGDREGVVLVLSADASGGQIGTVHMQYSKGDQDYEDVWQMQIRTPARDAPC